MRWFHAITTPIFDLLISPFGLDLPGLDLLIWPVLGGIVALIAYKYVSNQHAIARAKDLIRMHLYEVRLYRHDVLRVLQSTLMILVRNAQYVSYSLVPMVVMLVPMMTVTVQLVANYALDPAPVGAVELMEVALDPGVNPLEVQVQLPKGVVLDAPLVRTADGHLYARLRAEAAGDHPIALTVGDETLTKIWAVGGDHRKVAPIRTASLESFLYPAEAPIPASSAFTEVKIPHPVRSLAWLPDGELGVVAWFFGISLVAGFALRGPFGVTF
jgi:hypothetical protein